MRRFRIPWQFPPPRRLLLYKVLSAPYTTVRKLPASKLPNLPVRFAQSAKPGQARCGNFKFWHLGQAASVGSFKVKLALLVLDLAFACFFFGNGVMVLVYNRQVTADN